MSTAQDLINGAASLAGILRTGQSLQAGVNADALNRLNRMFGRWQNDGVDLGLSTLAATDTLYIDTADEEAVELGLAVRLMARHRRPIDPLVMGAAASSFVELQAKYTKIPEMDLELGLTKKSTYNIRSE